MQFTSTLTKVSWRRSRLQYKNKMEMSQGIRNGLTGLMTALDQWTSTEMHALLMIPIHWESQIACLVVR